jgi:CRP-like cAMP-binding protein
MFSGLSKKERDLVARFADEVDVPAGRTLTEEGGAAREVFVIESGTASVTRQGQVVATLGPGDIFGEIGVMKNQPRSATVTATSPMTLIVLFSQNFTALESQLDEVNEVVDRVMAERLAADQA